MNLSLSLYIYIYIHTYIYIHIHTHTHIYIYIYTYVRATPARLIFLRIISMWHKWVSQLLDSNMEPKFDSNHHWWAFIFITPCFDMLREPQGAWSIVKHHVMMCRNLSSCGPRCAWGCLLSTKSDGKLRGWHFLFGHLGCTRQIKCQFGFKTLDMFEPKPHHWKQHGARGRQRWNLWSEESAGTFVPAEWLWEICHRNQVSCLHTSRSGGWR